MQKLDFKAEVENVQICSKGCHGRILSKWWETSKMDIPQFTNNSALSLGEETSPFKMQKEMEKVYDQFIE